MWFEKIKNYYDKGYWTKEQVKAMVTCPIPKITPEEYFLITGEEYTI